jgi:hypothetical protein
MNPLDMTIRELMESPQAYGNYHLKKTVEYFVANELRKASEAQRENMPTR